MVAASVIKWIWRNGPKGWREKPNPKGKDLPLLPEEWTPLPDFMWEWSNEYTDQLAQLRDFSARNIEVRTAFNRLAYAWCCQHLGDLPAEFAERQPDGTFKSFALKPKGIYLMRHSALVRVNSNVIGRSVRKHEPGITEIFDDPHIKQKVRGKDPLKKAPQKQRARNTKTEIRKAADQIDAIFDQCDRDGEDHPDRAQLMKLTGLTQIVVQAALNLQKVERPRPRRGRGYHRKNPRK